jgi:hypothetical protein
VGGEDRLGAGGEDANSGRAMIDLTQHLLSRVFADGKIKREVPLPASAID